MRTKHVATMLTATALAASGAAAHTAGDGALKIIHPWVAPAEAGASTTAHPTLQNTGGGTLTITGAHTRAAAEVQLRRDGRAVERLTLDAGETLGPERVGMALRNLRVDLPAGKAVPIRVDRRDQPAVTVRFAIGRDTMDPEQTVHLPGDGDGDGA